VPVIGCAGRRSMYSVPLIVAGVFRLRLQASMSAIVTRSDTLALRNSPSW